MKGLTQEEIDILLERFPEDIIKENNGFKYIPVEHVIERLNRAFNYNWDFKISHIDKGETETKTSSRGNKYSATPVFITVELTVRSTTGSTLVRTGVGGGTIGFGQGEGDGHKSATSDALKKAAQSLGVGLYIAIEGKANSGKHRNKTINILPPSFPNLKNSVNQPQLPNPVGSSIKFQGSPPLIPRPGGF